MEPWRTTPLGRKLKLPKPLEREWMNQTFFTLALCAGLLPGFVMRCCDTSRCFSNGRPSRCTVLASTLCVSAPAARLHPRGVRSWLSMLGLDASRQPSLTQLRYRRIVLYFVRRLLPPLAGSRAMCKAGIVLTCMAGIVLTILLHFLRPWRSDALTPRAQGCAEAAYNPFEFPPSMEARSAFVQATHTMIALG